jgi:SNF2 family DNA or RNA helicase
MQAFSLLDCVEFSHANLLFPEQANIHANASNAGGDAVLGAFQRLRVVCSFAKVRATVELAKNILEKEPALVIFTCFAQVAKSVHEQLNDSGWNGELLIGETPQKKRQGIVDRFQVSTRACSWLYHTESILLFSLWLNNKGGSRSSVCLHIWCWWCRIDFDCCLHSNPSRSSLDTR